MELTFFAAGQKGIFRLYSRFCLLCVCEHYVVFNYFSECVSLPLRKSTTTTENGTNGWNERIISLFTGSHLGFNNCILTHTHTKYHSLSRLEFCHSSLTSKLFVTIYNHSLSYDTQRIDTFFKFISTGKVKRIRVYGSFLQCLPSINGWNERLALYNMTWYGMAWPGMSHAMYHLKKKHMALSSTCILTLLNNPKYLHRNKCVELFLLLMFRLFLCSYPQFTSNPIPNPILHGDNPLENQTHTYTIHT